MKQIIHTDEQEGTLTLYKEQDVTSLLDHLADQRNSGYTGSADMKFVGTIPPLVVENYLNEAGVTMQEFLKDDIHIMRIMNDPDYKHLRVWQGRM